MEKTKILIDSNCNMDAARLKALNIAVIPSIVVTPERAYKDGEEITANDIYRMCLDKSKPLPKTSAINESALADFFKAQLATAEKAVFITISSEISSIYANALRAREAIGAQDRLAIVDSRQLSCGIALVVERCQKDIEADMGLRDIETDLKAFGETVKVEFVVDTLENLYRGGRCSGLAFFFGKALHIHPIIGLSHGKMAPIRKVRGKDIVPGLDLILKDLQADLDQGNLDASYPVYTIDGDAKALQETYAAKLGAILGNKDIVLSSDASSVIAVHCGSGTLGIGWATKSNVDYR